jgi:8-oxo-dGTP pyrophosphatase MutT (NUDIX family)
MTGGSVEKQFSAGGVIIRKNSGVLEVLLIKDRFGSWTWPKGHMEAGETPEETALREINEETGLNTLRIDEKLGEQQYSFSVGDDQFSKTVYMYLVEAKSGEPLNLQRSEVDDGVWFSEEAALEKIDYEGSRAILEKGIKKFKNKGC